MTDRLATDDALRLLLSPASVAIVGGSTDESSMAAAPWMNLMRHGFTGDVHVVNPNRSKVGPFEAVPTVGDLPGRVDTAIVVTPAATLAGVLADLRSVTATATIVTAGFDDPDRSGVSRSEARELIAGSGLRVLGPNTAGLLNVRGRYCPRAARNHPDDLLPGNIALVTQSGAVGNVVFNRAQALGTGIGQFVATGDGFDISPWDVAGFLAEDPDTAVVVVIVEGAISAADLRSLAERAAVHGTTPVLLKMARTERGQAAARSHTGSLAGATAVELAAARSLGYVVVDDLDEAWQAARLLGQWGRLTSPITGLGVVSLSGGLGVEAADLAEQHGLSLPEPDPSIGGPGPPPSNPMDFGGTIATDPEETSARIERCRAALGDVPLLVATPVLHDVVAAATLDGVVAATRGAGGRTVLVTYLAGDGTSLALDRLRGVGAPLFDGLGPAFRALRAYNRAAARPSTLPPAPKVTGTPDRPSVPLSYWASSRLLEASIGLSFAPGGVAGDDDDVRRLFRQHGAPIVLKASCTEAAHKFAAGLVRLDVRSEDDAVAAHRDLLGRAAGLGGFDGIVCEGTAGEGLDLIVGGRLHESYGPIITVGLGGWLAEVVRDVAVIALDPSELTVATVLGETVVGRYLADRIPAGVAGVARAASRLAEAIAGGAIVECDINPLRVDLASGSVTALDAYVLVSA